MLKKIAAKFRESFSLYARIVFGVSLISLLLYVSFRMSPSFSDFFNRYISSLLRAFLAFLTSFIPFSLAETVVIVLPFLLILLFIIAIRLATPDGKKPKKGEEVTEEEKIEIEKNEEISVKRTSDFTNNLFATVLLLFNLFVWSFSAGYSGAPLEEKLDMERQPVTAEQLFDTGSILLEKITPILQSDIRFGETGASIMPYSRDTLNDLLNEAYKKACEKYAFLPRLHSKLKFIALSDLMTYTHISGVYSYYTGETNINLNYPDYTLPFTCAHEMAHQRGIAKEEEASFVAFLVCSESDDPYIRYSALLSVYEYVADALYQADPGLYASLSNRMPYGVYYEEAAFSKFFAQYRNSTASKVSGVVNDTYLKLQGQSAGAKSYDLVVDLAVSYFTERDD